MNEPRKWWYRFPGSFYAWGPTSGTFTTEREARRHIRELWNRTRLPKGTEVWPATK